MKLKNKNILIVEDEILIQKSLKKIFESYGAKVCAVSSGKSAIDEITKNSFDKIVCDLMLQDITGFDVIEESKKSMNLDEIRNKFIIITAYSSKQVLEKALEYGCIVISKPFNDITTILNALSKTE